MSKEIIEIMEDVKIELNDKTVLLEKGDRIKVLSEKTWETTRSSAFFENLPFTPGKPVVGFNDTFALGKYSCVATAGYEMEVYLFNPIEKEELYFTLNPEEMRNLKKLL